MESKDFEYSLSQSFFNINTYISTLYQRIHRSIFTHFPWSKILTPPHERYKSIAVTWKLLKEKGSINRERKVNVHTQDWKTQGFPTGWGLCIRTVLWEIIIWKRGCVDCLSRTELINKDQNIRTRIVKNPYISLLIFNVL